MTRDCAASEVLARERCVDSSSRVAQARQCAPLPRWTWAWASRRGASRMKMVRLAVIGNDTHASFVDEDISINTRRFPAAVTPGADLALLSVPSTH